MRRKRRTKPIARARTLRRNATIAERILWRALKSRQANNAKFRRQHPVGPYVADFAVIETRLIVEVDGGQHALESNRRTRYLESRGYRVIRFWNNEILDNLDGVLHEIATAMNDR